MNEQQFENILETIKNYMSSKLQGTLLVDTENNTLEWLKEDDVLHWGAFVFITPWGSSHTCECGKQFNEDCEACYEELKRLVRKVEGALEVQLPMEEKVFVKEEDRILQAQRKSITLLQEKLHYHEALYKVTKHSKRKAKHLMNMKFYRECVADAYKEYGWN